MSSDKPRRAGGLAEVVATGDPAVFAAVDIGASSGRVVAGVLDGGRIELEVIHRFPNGAVESDGHLRWDLTGLFAEVQTGLAMLAARHPGVVSIGIDTWGVDYGLLDRNGELIEEPIAYRDDRTVTAIGKVHDRVSRERLYAVTGLQYLPFNTLYQLAAEPGGPRWDRARRALLLPDLLAFWLTGEQRTEVTNASTTGLLDATTRTWSTEIFTALGLDPELVAPLVDPGEVIGTVRPEIARPAGLPAGLPVVAVGSHDTASAVVAVPMTDRDAAYISSGTWSLVGVELDHPVLSDVSREANFTNEGGVDGRVRYLRNVMGLWLLSESLQDWRRSGEAVVLTDLLAAAAEFTGPVAVFDANHDSLLPAGDMIGRIAALCGASGQPVPRTPVAFVRSICESLAAAYAGAIEDAQRLAGVTIDVVHVVGGGSQNALLAQLTADRTDRPVLAGPVEATALGNVLIQARASGLLSGCLEDLRMLVAASHPPVRYPPRKGTAS